MFVIPLFFFHKRNKNFKPFQKGVAAAIMLVVKRFIFLLLLTSPLMALHQPRVKVGADLIFNKELHSTLKGRKIGIVTNHTAVNGKMQTTADLFKENAKTIGYQLVAFFAPEHGIDGKAWAEHLVSDEKDAHGTPIYSLFGKGGLVRPTDKMLLGIDLLIFDIQDIGSRSYTYTTTLFYVMEEAAKRGIKVIVLDRPNPINGVVVDGPMLEEKFRSPVGYLNVPYCHGMTVGELATFFNEEYKIRCSLTVIPMRGWLRTMTFADTGLSWVPTSPQIPEASTALYYPTTGILGELQIVNIGVGYTLPFKVVGAPWIKAEELAKNLNQQHFPGVHFTPFHYRPYWGRFAKEDCQGVLITITDPRTYKPVATQYLLIGMLKSLYPEKFKTAFDLASARKEMFCKVNGTEEVYTMIRDIKHVVWKLRSFHQEERDAFLQKRKKYLFANYSSPNMPQRP